MSTVDWLFRDRSTGKIVIAQRPNAPLLSWLAATIVRWIAHPRGWFGTSLSVVATLALAIWAGDEVARGVNPFRRIIGAAVLALIAVSLIVRRT